MKLNAYQMTASEKKNMEKNLCKIKQKETKKCA